MAENHCRAIPRFERNLRGILDLGQAVRAKAVTQAIVFPSYACSLGCLDWRKGDTLFLHLFDPTAKRLDVPGFSTEVESVKYLATGEDLRFSAAENNLHIQLTPLKPDGDDTVIAVRTRGEIHADRRPHQSESGKILIPAWSLAVHGAKAKMRFDGFEKIAHLSDWTDPAETASCKFVANKPGPYQVSLTYCSDQAAAGSRAVLSFDDQKVDFVSNDTGGWRGGNYRVKNCGKVLLSRTGEHQFSIIPVARDWKNLAIKQVCLTPEK